MLTNLQHRDIDRNINNDIISLRAWRNGSSPSKDRRPHLVSTQTLETAHATSARCDDTRFSVTPHTVDISSPDAVARRSVISDVMTAEIVHVTSHERFAFRFRAPLHLLVVYEQGARRDGETIVEGLPRSTLRDFKQKLIFVPAGRESPRMAGAADARSAHVSLL